MERCLKKLVLEAETTGFQDPARTAEPPEEELYWKGSVGGQRVYTHECRRAKKLGISDFSIHRQKTGKGVAHVHASLPSFSRLR